MAFVVEDGTGVAGATAYAPVAYADDYFLTRGIAAWGEFTQEQKEGFLVQGTDYIDTIWGARLKGVPVFEGQALCFPRAQTPSAYTPGPLPVNLMKANCEYALMAGSGPLNASPVVDETGQLLQKRVEEVGPIKEEYTWHGQGMANFLSSPRPMPAGDNLMRPLTRTTAGVVR